jgi:hypothetical protein
MGDLMDVVGTVAIFVETLDCASFAYLVACPLDYTYFTLAACYMAAMAITSYRVKGHNHQMPSFNYTSFSLLSINTY